MNINPQDLGVNLTQTLGLTEWLDGDPPCVGWWNVRFKNADREQRRAPGRMWRRWWNGLHYSYPVEVNFHDGLDADELRTRKSNYHESDFEWQGLRAPITQQVWFPNLVPANLVGQILDGSGKQSPTTDDVENQGS